MQACSCAPTQKAGCRAWRRAKATTQPANNAIVKYDYKQFYVFDAIVNLMAPEEGGNVASTNLATFLRFLLLRRTNFGVKVMHLRHLTQKKYISKTSTEVYRNVD